MFASLWTFVTIAIYSLLYDIYRVVNVQFLNIPTKNRLIYYQKLRFTKFILRLNKSGTLQV